MKQTLLLFLLLTGLVTGSRAQNNNPNAAEFKFVEETHNFGNVPEGPDAKFDFVFTNVGKEPLIIQDCKGSCGCTKPEWSKAPVLPGKTGVITVRYETKDRSGTFNKSVFIASNAKSKEKRYEIKITGNVVPGDSKSDKGADKKP
ncbi:MAG TPA: DUF1573 domain-containing protein [Chitinophagaceae bacterium]|nr:DUF1573 domain-containing protein [Chitinophagaceae bacterium]